MAKPVKVGGLGRGLDSLFEDVIMAEEVGLEENGKGTAEGITYFEHDLVKPNPNQPRKHFDEEKLRELADSLLQHGMIQPIVVRSTGDGYTIVAGERRWRAAGIAGMEKIPCIVRNLTDEEDLLFALIENMQREDLNAIEEAEAFRDMTESFGMTQEQVSKAVGRSRPYISNAIRLLGLPHEIREMVVKGELSGGHARTLAAVEDPEVQMKLANAASRGKISVRELERAVSEKGRRKAKRGRSRNPELVETEDRLSGLLGGKVSLPSSRKRGKIEISFTSAAQLDAIIARLMELD